VAVERDALRKQVGVLRNDMANMQVIYALCPHFVRVSLAPALSTGQSSRQWRCVCVHACVHAASLLTPADFAPSQREMAESQQNALMWQDQLRQVEALAKGQCSVFVAWCVCPGSTCSLLQPHSCCFLATVRTRFAAAGVRGDKSSKSEGGVPPSAREQQHGAACDAA
jgi:hypothetical protein